MASPPIKRKPMCILFRGSLAVTFQIFFRRILGMEKCVCVCTCACICVHECACVYVCGSQTALGVVTHLLPTLFTESGSLFGLGLAH